MSSAADRNTRYCACTKYRVFLSADRANARTSRKPRVFEMHCERKRSVFVKRVSDLGVTEMKRVLFVTSEAVPFIKQAALQTLQVHCQNIFQKMNMKSASCCRSICVSVRICVRKCIIYCIFM